MYTQIFDTTGVLPVKIKELEHKTNGKITFKRNIHFVFNVLDKGCEVRNAE